MSRVPTDPRRHQVVHAYILIQTEVGKAASRAEADSVDDLGKLVVARIQAIEGITRTLTCPVVHL
jgi:hypothetical protein